MVSQKHLFIILTLLYTVLSEANIPVFNDLNQYKQLSSKNIKSIIQDESGLMWFGTSNGLYSYDGYKLSKSVIAQHINEINVNKLFIDSNKELWLGLKDNGLYRFEKGNWENYHFDQKFDQPSSIYDIAEDDKGNLFIATNAGLRYISKKGDKTNLLDRHLNYYTNVQVTSIELVENTFIMVTESGFSIYNILNETLNHYKLEDISATIHDIHIDYNNNLWIAHSKGLDKFDLNKKDFTKKPIDILSTRVVNIEEYKKDIWISTIGQGIFKISSESGTISNYLHNKSDLKPLLENNVYTTYISNSGILWVGLFLKGINYLQLDTLKFGYESNSENSINCINSNTIYSGILENKTIWLGSSNGFIKFNLDGQCSVIKTLGNEESPKYLISMYKSGNKIWLINVNSIFEYNLSTANLNSVYNFKKPLSVKFITYLENKNTLLVGTLTGMYQFNTENNTFNRLDAVNEEVRSLEYNNYFKNHKGELYFATSNGLVAFNENNKLYYFETINSQLENKHITAVNKINEDFYIGIKNKGLFKVANNHTEFIYNDEITINSIITHKKQLWIGTNQGLLKYDIAKNKTHLFEWGDGIYNDYLYSNSSYKSENTLFFGGMNGLIKFRPDEIQLQDFKANIVLTEIYLMNKKLNVNQVSESGFSINKPIDRVESIELSYKDYIIGFEFAALDYADSMRNQYAYRLKGLYDDWVYVDATDRKATFTNLKPGDYTFQVKASNKDGMWSEEPKELQIKVYPAPWFSPWAYFAYFVIVIFSIWAFIRYKTVASRKRAQQLEITVKERTHEVSLQKKMVESLLDHKNEVFANITHEFKTPLALIMGPADQLVEDNDMSHHSDKLNMIQRNAKRLMLMVGQILKLSQAEIDKEVIRESQAVQPTLTMLYESFKPLANDKGIEIKINNEISANVYATAECLEIVIGNLLSNALKFTDVGGTITIDSELNDKQVSISVKDTGTGIDHKDLDKVFKRFVRLDSHKSIQGTGIGLSVVKEITEANNGQVMVNSELGKGTVFKVTFPISDIKAVEEMSQVMVDQMVSNTENELTVQPLNASADPQQKQHKITVLIIEDNLDMQAHIGNVLKHRFNCLFADRGRIGIATALKEVPDIIICDVMMPEMDGYQVTRILRHDGRTSHIPIVLLTALNTKESRIKGWRENIDIYVTKPFDATELNVQLDNILMIRKMLQDKTNKAIKSNDSMDSLDLSEQDMKFIQKFKDVISKYYTNEYFQKADLASKMAVSERQLQRKIKALIDENPMEVLRDYRLEKAAIKLKQGYQVSICSDACGFSSVSYFGSCFKKKYGVTPKKYQQLK